MKIEFKDTQEMIDFCFDIYFRVFTNHQEILIDDELKIKEEDPLKINTKDIFDKINEYRKTNNPINFAFHSHE